MVSFYLFAALPEDYVLKNRNKKKQLRCWTGARARFVELAPMTSLYRLLRAENEIAEGGSFSPQDVALLGNAYEAILVVLRLDDRDDPLTEIIAAKLIELFQAGERDPAKLGDRTIQELGIPILLDGGDK
jgi:hypothetical protein